MSVGDLSSTVSRVSGRIRPVFLRWERLRVVYNALLLAVVLLPTGQPFRWPQPTEIPILLLGAVLANLCFLAGPVAESYLTWLGARSWLVSGFLFIGGVLISIPLVYMFGFAYATMAS